MGEGLSALLFEGDQTHRINEILKIFDYSDIQDFGDTTRYCYKYKINHRAGFHVKTGRETYFFFIGVHNGWTVMEYIDPSVCRRDCCIRASLLINARVIDMGYETHVGYAGLVIANKGRIAVHCEEMDSILERNEGAPYPLEIVDGDEGSEMHFQPYDIRKIVEQTIGYNVFDVLDDKMEIGKILVKTAYRERKVPKWQTFSVKTG